MGPGRSRSEPGRVHQRGTRHRQVTAREGPSSKHRQHIEFRCSPYDSHSALFPVVRHLERVLGFDQLEDAGEKLDRLEHKLRALGFSVPDVLPLLASQFSLPLPDRYSSPDLSG